MAGATLKVRRFSLGYEQISISTVGVYGAL
jgi:hypothetical protein